MSHELEEQEEILPPPAPAKPKEGVRWEDLPENQPKQDNPVELSAEEIDPESRRKDHTTVLAGDLFDGEGNRIN